MLGLSEIYDCHSAVDVCAISPQDCRSHQQFVWGHSHIVREPSHMNPRHEITASGCSLAVTKFCSLLSSVSQILRK